ncbi:hypothetical protein Tco_0679441 [Tanacetum coccineum]|uniref:Xylulose kinase-1 n=1 Tax=Tanacetum coccineum TaxID=301880 RepID=A0ABQ4XHZ8_9ASTR
MTTLQFADTHNLVAFLAKPAKSEEFEQIVDFLNAHTIKYALTVNPTIYTSCIEQFWATVKAKTINGEVQLQALVDGKKIIVTEASVRRDLQLNDEEGMDCLPNATIFKELTWMGAKTTTWNEFSSTMNSIIICLATNQKFNCSKYIFESMVKNLDNAGKFLMYPRFLNMRMLGKGFSGRDTPLFPTMMVQAQQEQGEGSTMPTDPQHTPTIIQPSTSQPQKKQRSRRPKRKDTEVPQPSGPTTNVANEAVYKERDDSLERAVTTAIGLDAKQDRGNINKIQSKATPNERSSPGTSSGGGPRRQETIRDTIAQTRSEIVSKFSNDLLLARENKDCLSLGDYKFKTESQEVREERRVKNSQAQNIIQEITLVHETQERYGDEEMFDTSIIDGDEVLAEPEVTVKDVNLSVDEVTLAQALTTLKSAKVQEKANVVEEPSESITTTPTLTTTTTVATTIIAVSTRPRAKWLVIHEEEEATKPTVSSQQLSQVKAQDKGKGIMVEEPIKMKKKDQISLDGELTFKLQAEEEEEERLAREKAQREEEANIVSWDNLQAMIDADYQMAQQMQAEEQEELSIKEKSKLFVQLLEARKKHFAAMRAK